ncbi:MAG: PilZ domain-containing protein [Alphaproteobacteria bacterium]
MKPAPEGNQATALKRRGDPAGHVRLRVSERRFYRRGTISTPAILKIYDESYAVELVDISLSGAQIRCAIVPRAGTEIDIEMRGVGIMPARVIRRLPNSFAVEFNLCEKLRSVFAAALDTLVMAPA